MTTTRDTLQRIGNNVEESMGVRERDLRPALSPVPFARDIGCRPVRNIGRAEIGKVIPDPDQPRVDFDEDALERLAQSIREKGQLSPIRVRWSSEMNTWVIISGERRWRATRKAGLPDIECYFHDGDLSRSEILEQALIENLLREDLQPLEEAKAYTELQALNGWSNKVLAEALRIDPSKVTRALSLLKLPEDIQAQVAEGKVSARSGYEISRIPNEVKRRHLADQAARGLITHNDAAREARGQKGTRARTLRGTSRVFQLSEGWKVSVTSRKKASGIEIETALLAALAEARRLGNTDNINNA